MTVEIPTPLLGAVTGMGEWKIRKKKWEHDPWPKETAVCLNKFDFVLNSVHLRPSPNQSLAQTEEKKCLCSKQSFDSPRATLKPGVSLWMQSCWDVRNSMDGSHLSTKVLSNIPIRHKNMLDSGSETAQSGLFTCTMSTVYGADSLQILYGDIFCLYPVNIMTVCVCLCESCVSQADYLHMDE